MSFIFYSSENDITFTALAKILKVKLKDLKRVLQYKGYFKRSKLEPFDFYIRDLKQDNYFAYRHYNGVNYSSIVITEQGQHLILNNWNKWLEDYNKSLNITETMKLREVTIKINRTKTSNN